mmetsp:Transcript_8410/g.11326  ORF Transcript_8410/g.11326 Transcript_8410/m.11326 type:complete len:835 (-) Transcript_8410:32-2536(-)
MDIVAEAAQWEQLLPYNRYYRRMKVYDMYWQGMDLKQYIVAIAPFGGAVALRRNPRHPSSAEGGDEKVFLDIYTSSGKRMTRILWTRGRIVGWGWSNQENLVVVTEEGLVAVLPLTARADTDTVHQNNLGKHIQELLVDVRIWGNGLVVMTKSFQFWKAKLTESTPRAFAASGLSQAPTSWTILEPEHTVSRDVEVLIANETGTIYVLDFDVCQDQLLSAGPFTSLAVASGGKLLACFTTSGVLMVISTDFSDNKIEFPTGCPRPPKQFIWCGLDTVLLYWEEVLLMVGPKKDDKVGWLRFKYSEPIAMVTEIDGARIISNSVCEFLQKVPDVTEGIFKLGSVTPPALLYEASGHFEHKNPRAYENIRHIKNDLTDAVSACVEAAGYEFEQSTQRKLLKAASFGKCFLDLYNPDDFVNMCKRLRVLNAVHFFRIGIPITIAQLQRIGIEGLVDRLIHRNEHLLALRICEFMKLKGRRVLEHWACAKVQSAKGNADPESLARLIVEKLSRTPGMSYARIASTAFKNGHRELALLLLDHEPRAADQVPLLTYMQQDDIALVKAIESGDTDLVYLVILHIKRLRSPDEFVKLIRNQHVALSLVIKYCKQQDTSLLKDIYYQQNNREELGNMIMNEAYQQPSLEKGLKTVSMASQVYSDGKDTALHARYAEDEKKLLILQSNLEKKLKKKFLGLSVTETAFRLLVLGNVKAAERIKSDFKISEKRYWWLRLKAISELKDWPALNSMAREKKNPPIGWIPFAEVCIANKQNQEAARYIPKIPELEIRMKLWISIGYWRAAAELAAKELKDVKALIHVKSKCSDQATIQYIDAQLRSLGV